MRETTTALRAARTARGWSQSRAAREIVALALARGTPVASAASLKSLLSRWENGHSVPEPQYRALLGELFDRTSGELGIDDPAGDRESGGEGTAGASGLRAALAAAAAVDAAVLGLWREQLEVAQRLDDELGSAGAGTLVSAQVDQLDRTLDHTLAAPARGAVAAVLTGAAALAGAQSLDRADHRGAWRHYGRAGYAAREAGLPVAAAVAVAGRATVLVDLGDPASALTLLGEAAPSGPPAARVRWAAARGLARAAVGHDTAARSAFATAEHALREIRVDAVSRAEPAVELADLHRWHGRALVTLGRADAHTPLELAMDARPRSARHRAALHADLAIALGAARPAEAAEHARQARALATRIGSARIAARLSRPFGNR